MHRYLLCSSKEAAENTHSLELQQGHTQTHHTYTHHIHNTYITHTTYTTHHTVHTHIPHHTYYIIYHTHRLHCTHHTHHIPHMHTPHHTPHTHTPYPPISLSSLLESIYNLVERITKPTHPIIWKSNIDFLNMYPLNRLFWGSPLLETLKNRFW